MNFQRTIFMFLLVFASNLWASDLIVEKQKFTLDNFKTFNGKLIKQVNVGWEAYGTLNEDKSNVILITHYFTGNSHAAGKYSKQDAMPGYWDSIIGPGKAIDTNKYYVISSDTLVNAGAFDKNVITTGPASINPDTGMPYGLSFPVVTIRDFVNVQKALIESMGITKLHAVVGASMGSMQALEWAVAYPDMVERMVSVIGIGQSDAWLVAGLEKWAAPIKQDPNWNNGDYYQSEGPNTGLMQSLATITQEAMHPAIFNASNPNHKNIMGDALHDIKATFPVVDWLYGAAKARLNTMDANHILYLVRASQLFVAGHNDDLAASLAKVTAKSLFLPASNDLLLFPEMAKKTHEMLGDKSQYEEIKGMWGHLDGLFTVQQKAKTLSDFLEQE
ncbi:homoserine O-acetyltransferase [Thalassotalea sp. 1_MG-2023]|uniref:E22 family MetX-like putative esterase n=1 Tax=Thalassotalea sp. 1_MG-2023 TaxID=3062680 RepID=UPI0026E198DA|nr:homoserine O-acetyltransferase [Thalassotalea sp. 1_MG-2023]MDO6426662.1 homoserine O-acetyltransferase [Thalassotalea sp. 1_MG-2023]